MIGLSPRADARIARSTAPTTVLSQTFTDSMRVSVTVTEATWLRISGYWYPRGGIPIDVFWQSGEVPSGLYVPETGVAGYRGRG